MRGARPVAALRFREALAGRILWLLPLHFALALAAAAWMPGPTAAARIEAADAAALGLAAFLGLAAAAVAGAGPLPAERERARGTMVLAAAPGDAARVCGTFLGTGTAVVLLLLGLCASSMVAVDLGAGAGRAPRAYLRWSAVGDGRPDPREPGLYWTHEKMGWIVVRFPRPMARGDVLVVDARPRVGREGALPGWKRATFTFCRGAFGERPPEGQVSARTGLTAPFRVEVPAASDYVILGHRSSDLQLGLRREGVRLDDGPRPRAVARGLHAAALAAGLLAAAAAAMALSTVAGTGVAAAGALALALLSLFRSTFADAASMLAHAGAMERAMEAAEHGPAAAGSQTVTPPALAPLFEALAAVLPDGTRFDLSPAVAAGEVPDPGDAAGAAALGLAVAGLFLAAAVAGARRRP